MGRLHVGRANLLGSGFDLKSAAVAGAAANTDIAVPGLKRGDEIFTVLASDFTDQTANASIQANGTLRLTTATGTLRLFVIWYSS